MADYTVSISLPDHKRGDVWNGIASIGPVIINGAQPTNTLQRIRMFFVKGSEVFKLDSDTTDRDAQIVIQDANTWLANIPAIEKFLKSPGQWYWDMEFYEQGKTTPLTLYKGVLVVHNDITK